MNRLSAILAAGLLAGCMGGEEKADVKVEPFGTTKSSEAASLYTIEGKDGLKIVVSDFGGRLVKCFAPDRNGNMADVTLGWNSVKEYEELGFSMGTLIGRYGNRIRDGRFTLDGRTYQLPINETTPAPRNCNLHSGPDGWDAKVWKAKPFAKGDVKGLELTYVDKGGENGFPGDVTAKVTYSVLPGNIWRVEYELTSDKPTVVNPTHHSYWNLAGESSGDVLEQHLQIFADKFTKTDDGLIPVEDVPVAGTGFDFTYLRPIGYKMDWMKAQDWLKPMDNWYDHNFVLRGKPGEMKQAVEMFDPKSGRVLEIWTTEPCMQMYGAQNMDIGENKNMPSKTPGKNLCQYAGIALETQHYPDSPNHPEFPSTVLRPGETFRSVTEYRFKTR